MTPSHMDTVLEREVADLEALAVDQEREELEEKRQYDEAVARRKDTQSKIRSLKRGLSDIAKSKQGG